MSAAPALPSARTPAWQTASQHWRARGSATRLLHSRAVIVDVETTGFEGRICEIAVLDTTGRVLLDTLVDPQTPIPPEATTVHGITNSDVVDAPTWPAIAAEVEQLLAGHAVIAYNAPFDRGRVRAEQLFAGRTTPGRWWCLMRARAAVDGGRWRALHGGHRAAGDCRAALTVLEDLAVARRR